MQVLAPSAGCSTLIASQWRVPVPTAVLGDTGDVTRDYQIFATEQTGQLGIANTFKAAAIETVEKCEARDAAAVKHITRPWYRRIF